jgi:hypothetical protein
LVNNPVKDAKFKELFDIQVNEKVVEEPTSISPHQAYDYNTRTYHDVGKLYLREIHVCIFFIHMTLIYHVGYLRSVIFSIMLRTFF